MLFLILSLDIFMDYKSLKLNISDKIALLTLSQPEKYNSMTPVFWEEMVTVFDEIENSDARVAIINAEGKHFSSGIDLHEFSSLGLLKEKDIGRNAENIRNIIKKLQTSFNVIANSRIPVIAAIHGACIGGAVDLISACDIRYGSVDSFFSIHEVKIGMVADVGTLQRLPNIIPLGLMMELALTGRKMYSKEALKSGLLNSIYNNKSELLNSTINIAKDICNNSPIAVTGTKKIIKYSLDHNTTDSLDYVALWNSAMLQSKDFIEAISAQIEKREAKFDDIKPAPKLLK